MRERRNSVADQTICAHICWTACALVSIMAGCASDSEQSVIQTSTEIVVREKNATAAFVVVTPDLHPQSKMIDNAALREGIRQETTWTSENIQRFPYLFLQDQIRQCDSLKAKIESQVITLTRMEKEANRKSEEANGAIARYSHFLELANAAYDAAEANNKWPAVINGYEMSEEELGDKMEEAQTCLELAKKNNVQNTALAKKVEIRKNVLKKKKHELANLRPKLIQQAEQLKMNEALAQVDGLKDVLGFISNMMVEIDGDSAQLTLDDVMAEDPKEAKKARIRAIREKRN